MANISENSGSHSTQPFLKAITNADNGGQNIYKSGNKMLGMIQAAGPLVMSNQAKDDNLAKLAESKQLKNIPYLGQVLGMLDFYVGGNNKKTSSGTVKETVALTTSGSINMTGNITKHKSIIEQNYKFYVPGSKHPSLPQSNSQIPFYNEPLGVFMMIEPPLIKYVEYSDRYRHYLPKIRQYKIEELPIFKINPSSGLEIEEMKVSIVLDYKKKYNNNDNPSTFRTNAFNKTSNHNHPVLFSDLPPSSPNYAPAPYSLYEKNADFNLEKELIDNLGSLESVRLTLGQIPIGCFQNTSFYLTHDANKTSEELVLKIRFNLLLKETATGKIHNMIHVYNVPNSYILPDNEVEESLYYNSIPYNEFYGHEDTYWSFIPFKNSVFSTPLSVGTQKNYYPEKNTNTLDILYFKDEIVPTGSYTAWELIGFDNNVTLQGNSSFYSFGEIFINDSNQFSPENTFSTTISDAHCYDNPMDFNTEDLGDFCNDINKYKRIRTIKNHAIEKDTVQPIKSLDFRLFPNPTSTFVKMELPEIGEGSVYRFTLFDLRGQRLKDLFIKPSDIIDHVYEIDVTDLTKGIYFVRLTVDGVFTIKELVIL